MLKKLGGKKKENLPAKQEEEKEMSFLEHLEELRWHLVRSVISIVVIAIVVFFFKDLVTKIINAPRFNHFPTHRLLCKYIEVHCDVNQMKVITMKMAEEFITHLKTSLSLGLLLSFPYIFWEIWRFVKPGLYENERKAARGIVAICSFLFFLGVFFGYFIVAPFAINFLAGYTFGETNESTVSLSSYISYMVMVTFPVGIIFQLPVMSYILAKIGILTSSFMKNYRRHAIVIIFIIGAVISPPDLPSQFLLALPLLGLYELSIRIVSRIEKKEEKKLSAT